MAKTPKAVVTAIGFTTRNSVLALSILRKGTYDKEALKLIDDITSSLNQASLSLDKLKDKYE